MGVARLQIDYYTTRDDSGQLKEKLIGCKGGAFGNDSKAGTNSQTWWLAEKCRPQTRQGETQAQNILGQ